MLLEYIRNLTERIISEREQNGTVPSVCTLHDLMAEAKDDITECMRDLHRNGEYRASTTVNKIPMLLRNTDETNGDKT